MVDELNKVVRLELESYRLLVPTRFKLIVLLSTLTISIASCFFTLIITLQPLAYLNGEVASGVIYLTRYELKTMGVFIKHPPLDSLVFISWFLLLKVLVTLFLGVICIYGLFVKYRVWIGVVPIVSMSSALLVSLLYSLLRVHVVDVVPALVNSVSTHSLHGAIVLDRPKVVYTWVAKLPSNTLLFSTWFNALLILTSASLMVLLYTPRPLVLFKKKGLPRLHRVFKR